MLTFGVLNRKLKCMNQDGGKFSSSANILIIQCLFCLFMLFVVIISVLNDEPNHASYKRSTCNDSGREIR